MASATITLPGVLVSTPVVNSGAQDLIGLPTVTVSAANARSSVIGLPVVVVSKAVTSAVISLPPVVVSSPQQVFTVPAGQFHLDAGGVWRPFIVAHLGADGQWRNLADGAVVKAVNVVTATVNPNV